MQPEPLPSLRRRANRAREGRPAICVTCPASRHSHRIAEALVTGRPYPMLAEEPQHCGESILAAVAALWDARLNDARFAFLQSLPAVEAQAFFWNYSSARARIRAIDAAMAAKEQG